MPLPQESTPWPPPAVADLSTKWREWSAWWSDDTDALASLYGGAYTMARPSERGGLAAAIGRIGRRMFWGEGRTDLTRRPDRKLHVPIAGDLCQASADLLLSEPPSIAVSADPPAEGTDPYAATRERLQELTGSAFHAALVSGAETGAALGGTYLRVTWDKVSHPEGPFITTVDYDAAVPEFRWGRLTALTLWHVVREDGNVVWRHLERHEIDPATGHGVIVHGLYQGTAERLGHAHPLEDHPVTAPFADLVDENSAISTGSPGLAVVHWPNATPNRAWRTHALGRHLGRSDLEGLEGLLDALDEAYTSLMRDIRLGRAMLMVPRTMLETHGPGGGMSFDHAEVYSPVTVAPSTAADASLQVEQVQFNIRVAEHEATIALLWNTLIRSAGYSAQTFGEGDTMAATATEVQARERRSSLSKARKSRTMAPAIAEAVGKMLAVDAAIFRTPGVDPAAPISVEIADGVQEDLKHLAEVANTLRSALAASIETRVSIVHPDWTPLQVAEEVERIQRQEGLLLADPDTVGVDGEDLSAEFDVEDDAEAPADGEADS